MPRSDRPRYQPTASLSMYHHDPTVELLRAEHSVRRGMDTRAASRRHRSAPRPRRSLRQECGRKGGSPSRHDRYSHGRNRYCCDPPHLRHAREGECEVAAPGIVDLHALEPRKDLFEIGLSLPRHPPGRYRHRRCRRRKSSACRRTAGNSRECSERPPRTMSLGISEWEAPAERRRW